jgi:hypothetical protein
VALLTLVTFSLLRYYAVQLRAPTRKTQKVEKINILVEWVRTGISGRRTETPRGYVVFEKTFSTKTVKFSRRKEFKSYSYHSSSPNTFSEPRFTMRFKTKQTLDDLSEDADGASDIISQEENTFERVTPRAENVDNKKKVTPEWSDPWSSDNWKNGPWADPTNQNQSRIETSFESLQFTPVLKTTGENSDLLDVEDAFGMPFRLADIPSTDINMTNFSGLTMKRESQATVPTRINKGVKINIGVVVKERLSVIFDETTNDPSCKVVGSIYVKPTKRKISSFSLTIRDSRAHVEYWDERNSRCRNITAGVPHLALDSGDQVFSISLNREHQHNLGLDAPVVSYTCIPRLRPMPMVRVL